MKTSDPSSNDTLEKAFGKVLRLIRMERGLSQEDLGFRSGYHRTYISQLERGQKNPSLRTIFHLAEVLEVDADEMIQRVGSSIPSDTSDTRRK